MYTKEQLDFIRMVNGGGGVSADTKSSNYHPKAKAEYKSKRKQGEDLTVDGYINKHGGIESSIDGKIYTNKSSYMEHIKANGCEIKDW